MGGLKYPGYTTTTTTAPTVRLLHCNTCSVSSYPPPPPQYLASTVLQTSLHYWCIHFMTTSVESCCISAHTKMQWICRLNIFLVQFVNIPTVFYLKVLSDRPAAVTDYVDADLGQNLILSSDSVIGNKEAVRLDIATHLPSYPTQPRSGNINYFIIRETGSLSKTIRNYQCLPVSSEEFIGSLEA